MKNNNPVNILLAEDDPTNQELIKAYIEDYKFNLDIANNGDEVLELIDQKEYNLILMDVQMPKLNGFETTKRIREMEKDSDKHIPIIALTAYAMKNDRDKCLNAGMDDYFSKPIMLNTFIGIINKHLNQTL